MQLMACIGEHFTEGDDICGVVVNIRAKQDRLSVWTKTSSDESVQVWRIRWAILWEWHQSLQSSCGTASLW